MNQPIEGKPGRYWRILEDGRIQCDLCPRYCKLHEGQRGLCFVRARQGGQMVLTTYGRSSGFCIDPIEKKPLNHFLPGTRILTFLLHHDPRALKKSAADRITAERVRTYIDSLFVLGNGSATILARLQELGEVAKVMSPRNNWGFLNRFSSKVRAKHVPARSKAHLRLSNELFDLGLRLIEQSGELEGLAAAIAHRDGLMIALLALVPLRRRNIAGLRLDQNLINAGGSWLIVFDATETKTHAPLEMMWPDELLGPLAIYLAVHRPLLASLSGRWSKPVDCALWVSSHGSPMTEIAIYDRIRRHTEEAFGKAINPHLFRDAAATTLAIADLKHVRVAAPLLGHRTFTTTERYYQQARSLEAHHAYVEVLFGKENKR